MNSRLITAGVIVLSFLFPLMSFATTLHLVNNIKNIKHHADFLDIFVEGIDQPIAGVDMGGVKNVEIGYLNLQPTAKIRAFYLASCKVGQHCTDYTLVENLPESCALVLNNINNYVINGELSEFNEKHIINNLSCSAV